MLVTAIWVIVTTLGWVFQHWHNRGRPPFPPPPRSTRQAVPETSSTYGAVTDITRRVLPRVSFWGQTGPPVLPTRDTERTGLLSGTNG